MRLILQEISENFCYNRLMHIPAAVISVILIADGVFLLFDPSFYRRSLVYIDEMLGPIWSWLYGLFFFVSALFLFLCVKYTNAAAISAGAGVILVLFGLFFILSCTERFGYFNKWWSTRPNWVYRLAGLAFIILSGMIFHAVF